MKGLKINGYEIIATRRINGTSDEWLAVFHRPEDHPHVAAHGRAYGVCRWDGESVDGWYWADYDLSLDDAMKRLF